MAEPSTLQIWLVLKGLYGSNLVAATVTTLTKTGEHSFAFDSRTYPNEDAKPRQPEQTE